MTPRSRSTFGGVTSWLASVEPLVVLAIAPALLFPTPARLSVLALVPLVAWANRRVHGRAVPSTPLNQCLFLLLVMTAVSLGATPDVRNSLGKVAGVVLGVLTFSAVTRWTNSKPRLAAATGVFLFAGATLAVIGLLGINWFGKFGVLGPIIERLPKAIRGVPGAEEGFHPNAVAGCLVLFIPLQVALLTRKVRSWFAAERASRSRHLPLLSVHAGLLALTAGALILTQSRGAWSGLVVAFVAFLLWYRRSTRMLALSLVASLAVLAIAMGPHRLANFAISQSGPGMARNVVDRVELWSRAISGIQDFPFTGMGMNVFRRAMPRMYPTVLARPDVPHAHNHVLQAALDLGIPGLIAYLAIWITVGALLWMVYRGSAEPTYRAMAGVLGAGLIAHFTFSLADVIPLGSKVGVLFWLTLALAVALHHVVLPPATDAPPDRVL